MYIFAVPLFYLLQVLAVSAAARRRGDRPTALLICHSCSVGLVHAAGTPRSITHNTVRLYLCRGAHFRPCSRQAQFGDYEPDQPRPLDHISQWRFAPNQNKEMEEKILELHKTHMSDIKKNCIILGYYIFNYTFLYI